MATLTYAGIGARATPAGVLADMTVMAGWLARIGWHLASGGADGADSAYARGAPAGRRTICLPWPCYNGHRGPDCQVLSGSALSACMAIAADLHPAWDRCSRAVRKLHARNVAIILGETCDRPVSAAPTYSQLTSLVGSPIRQDLDILGADTFAPCRIARNWECSLKPVHRQIIDYR